MRKKKLRKKEIQEKLAREARIQSIRANLPPFPKFEMPQHLKDLTHKLLQKLEEGAKFMEPVAIYHIKNGKCTRELDGNDLELIKEGGIERNGRSS